jgi:hypothetical protein
MMVFWKARLVILAVPKTGSEALEAALAARADMAIRFPPFYRHMNVAWYEKSLKKLFLPEDKARLETLAVVREPVDWLGSWYRYRARADLDGTERSTRALGFADFVEGWLAEPPPPFANVGRQSRFCARADGSLGIDHLFAYEAPETLHAFLEARTGLAVRTERVNVSPLRDTTLPEALRDRLRRQATAEFELHARARR